MSLYKKMSFHSKVIHWIIGVPFIISSLYLYWKGHESMSWVNEIRNFVFGSNNTDELNEKFNFFIIIISSSVLSLVSGLLYDYITKKGLFERKVTRKNKKNKFNLINYLLERQERIFKYSKYIFFSSTILLFLSFYIKIPNIQILIEPLIFLPVFITISLYTYSSNKLHYYWLAGFLYFLFIGTLNMKIIDVIQSIFIIYIFSSFLSFFGIKLLRELTKYKRNPLLPVDSWTSVLHNVIFFKPDFDIEFEARASDEIERIVFVRKGRVELAQTLFDVEAGIRNASKRKNLTLRELQELMLNSNVDMTEKDFRNFFK